MATPTIEAISTQDITIDTDYELEIGITNDPEEVTVGGLLEGFHYSWDADNDTLTIAGGATRLLGDAIWEVRAKEIPTSTAVTREITYNVVSSAPIIEEIGTQMIFQGAETDIFVEIQNSPTQVVIDGLLTGFKFEVDTEVEGDDVKKGVRLSGRIPRDANLTVDAGVFDVTVSNGGGEDTYGIPFNVFPDVDNVYLFKDTFNSGDKILYKISPLGSLLWTYTAPTGNYHQISADDDGNVYLFDDEVLYKISSSGSLLWTYTALSTDYEAMVVDGDGNVYLFDENDEDMYKISPSGSLLWTYDATGSFGPPWVDGDGNAYLFYHAAEYLEKISPSGSLLWTYDASDGGAFYPGVVDGDGNIYLIFFSQTGIYKISPSGSLLWTYGFSQAGDFDIGLPLGLDDDGNVHFLDDGNAKILYKISPSGSLLWTNTVNVSGTVSGVSPYATVVAGDGHVFIGSLIKISPSGSLLWTNILSGVFDAAEIDGDGNAYLFEDNDDTLYKISPSGSILWTYTAPTGDYSHLILAR